MPIYFFAAAIEPAEGEALETRIRRDIPDLQKVISVDDLTRQLPSQRQSGAGEKSYVLFPFSQAQTAIDRLVDMAARGQELLFFIFISEDISASDYKRLVRAGNADWVSSRGAPQEILDIVARHRHGNATAKPQEPSKPVLVAFVPSAGGIGNSTLAIETAVQIKTQKGARPRAACLVDLDFQTSHVCDLLDIEPRLQLGEISQHPERLDAQLFDLFVSRHSTGLHVVAAGRSKDNSIEPNIAGLDALFAMISQHYNLILVDLPLPWFGWTRQILSAADLAVVTGLATIPSLRQAAETVKALRELEHPPARIVVALNRCESGLLGGVTGRPFAKRMLDDETVFYVRGDAALARQSVNTGVPISVAAPSSRVSKDIAKLAGLIFSMLPAQSTAAG